MTAPDSASGERPVEVPPETPSSAPLWLPLLAGPVIWIVHFVAVYLLAEATCAAGRSAAMRFIGPEALVVAVIFVTVTAAAGTLVVALRAWRRSRHTEGDVGLLAKTGLLLALGSFAAVVIVGVPALVLSPC